MSHRGFSTTEFLIVLAVVAVGAFFIIPFVYNLGNSSSFSSFSYNPLTNTNKDKVVVTNNPTTGKPDTTIYSRSDTVVKSDLDTLETQAALDFQYGGTKSYGPPVPFTQYTTSFTATGASGALGVSIFGQGSAGDQTAQNALNDAVNFGGPLYYGSNGTSYFIAAQLENNTYWCVDPTTPGKVQTQTPSADGDGATDTCSQP